MAILKTSLNLGQLSMRIRKLQIKNAAREISGKTGFFQVWRNGIFLSGRKIVADKELTAALIERNFRNLLLPKPQSMTALLGIFSKVISQPEEAEESLSSIGAVFNLPENILDKSRDFSVIKTGEGGLFLAEKGEIYTLEQIKNGEVPLLGEEVIEFMQTHGLNRLVFAEGTVIAPHLEIGLGGQIAYDGKGMSRMKTVNWASAVARLDAEKCGGCIQCVVACPEESIHIVEGTEKEAKPKIEIDLTNCKGCGLCANACPTKISAITMIGKDTPDGVALLGKILGRKRR